MLEVSVIIPVFNARDTLEACLDSVLAQTLDDLEILLVDDHGTDGSIQFARSQAAAYKGPKQFRFLGTPANAGPGVARNEGIAHAQGLYIAFLDADDTLEPDFCRRLLEAAARSDADLAAGSISLDTPDGRSDIRHNPPVQDGPFEGLAKRAYLRRFTSYFTTYLYRRALLQENGIVFPGTHSAEDSCFLICALLSTRRMAADPEALYHYRLVPGSTSRKKDPQRWRNRLESFRTVVEFARERGLQTQYRGIIRWLVFKKGYLMAARDYLSNNLFNH